jgi:PAS domain-containing protein
MTSSMGSTSVLMRRTKAEVADEVTAFRGRISDFEKTEKALRDVEERYALINQATRGALFEWDLETDQNFFPTDEREALGLLSWDGQGGGGWNEFTQKI